jgi:hypothetical protein
VTTVRVTSAAMTSTTRKTASSGSRWNEALQPGSERALMQGEADATVNWSGKQRWWRISPWQWGGAGGKQSERKKEGANVGRSQEKRRCFRLFQLQHELDTAATACRRALKRQNGDSGHRWWNKQRNSSVAPCSQTNFQIIMKMPLRLNAKLLWNFLWNLKFYKYKSCSKREDLQLSCFDLFKFCIIFEIWI